MQEFEFSGRCVTACMFAYASARTHVCVSASPKSIFCMCKQMFCVAPVQQRSGPSIFLSSPSPLLLFSPFTSICSSGPCGWHLRPSGGAEESGHLTNWWPLQLQLQRSSLPPICSCLGGRKWGRSRKRESWHARRHSAMNTRNA